MVSKTPLTWTQPASLALNIGEAVKAGSQIVGGVASLDSAEWTPPCPGLDIDDQTLTTGSLMLVGSPKQSGTFQMQLKATSLGGDSETKSFEIVVKSAAAPVLADATPTAPPMPAASAPDKPVVAAAPASVTPVVAATTPPSGGPMADKPSSAPGSPPVPSATPPPVPVPSGPAPAQETPSIAMAKIVAQSIPGTYLEVINPKGGHNVPVTEQNWKDGEVVDLKAGKTLVLNIDTDPKLEIPARDINKFEFKAKNPYTTKEEIWGEDQWKDGATRTWGPFTYHLPTPVPRFTMETATYEGDRMIKSPYPSGGKKKVSWLALATGGEEVKDNKGMPMKVPQIEDPHEKAKVLDRTKRTYINPYTEETEAWKGSPDDFRQGAKVSWKGDFTFVLGVIPENKPEPKPEPKPVAAATPPPPPTRASSPPVKPVAVKAPEAAKQAPPGEKVFSTQRGFVMEWVPTGGYWICNHKAAAQSASLADLCDQLTKDSIKKGNMPSNFKFVARPDGQGVLRMMAVPK